MILFLGNYPIGNAVKEGMSQRMLNIDGYYSSNKRIYLNVSLFRNLLSHKNTIDDKLSIYHYNAFLHAFFIIRFFIAAQKIYIHSVYNVLPSILYIFIFSKHYILDIHGVVPEENAMIGSSFRYKVFSFCEYIILHKNDVTAVVVTNKMKDHYQKKYPNNSAKFVNYVIFPNNLKTISIPSILFADEHVNFVYAGNLQQWQNIDLMIQNIALHIHNEHYYFYILTGELERMREFLAKRISDFSRISLQSLPPSQLAEVYKICHYGFVLRDDIVVNNVACPTKIIEYMHYGIVPVVLNDSIGDFESYHYERVLIDDINDLKPYKSLKNIAIIEEMKEKNAEVDVYSL